MGDDGEDGAYESEARAVEVGPHGQRVRANWLARIDMHSPHRRRCCSCRALAVVTRVVDLAELGLRRHDQCRDCMIAGIRLNWAAGRPVEGRYRVTLWAGDRPILQGWWDEPATAEGKRRGGSTRSGAGKEPASPWTMKRRAPGWRAGQGSRSCDVQGY
ncbi:hypothetical protein [Streptomyces mirabilis]|uniref:hypothetical protein n=1 Tax=Streptomyces mirabilis TaxID=68239 RepID=UPI0036790B68